MVHIAKEFGGFGSTQFRIALDYAPLQGAGRVENTFSLVGHALKFIVDCKAAEHKRSELLKPKVLRYGSVEELSIDRGYFAV